MLDIIEGMDNKPDFDSWWESILSEEREEYIEQCDSLSFEPFDEDLERIARMLEKEERLHEEWSSLHKG